jgi:hypothetical protein
MAASDRHYKRILLVGDLHANVGEVRGVVDTAVEEGADLIVQVGDLGYWPRVDVGQQFLAALDKRLRKKALDLWFVDGNHEDHESLGSARRGPGLTRIYGERVYYVPRATRIELWPGVAGTQWLFLGGAVSVDRAWRLPGRDWFADEVPTDAQVAAAIAGGPADVVVAHEAPTGGAWLGQRLAARAGHWPAAEIRAAGQFQDRLRQVCDAVRPAHWWHGHHHVEYEDRIGDCAVHGLACDNRPTPELTRLVDACGRPLDEPSDEG